MTFYPNTSIVAQQPSPYTGRTSNLALVQSLTRGPNAPIQHQTILDYAPSIYLCQYDDALNGMWPTEPWNQTQYLNYCSLKQGSGGDSDPVITNQPTPADLAKYPANSGVYLCVNDGSARSPAFQGCGSTTGPNAAKYASAHMLACVKAYAPEDNFFDIVYTGFWSVNYYQWMYLRLHYYTPLFPSVTSDIAAELTDIAYHMGDWEHVTVRVALENNQPGQMLGVFFGAHGKGRWGRASDLVFDSGQHVWVSNKGNSHAFHPEQGDIQLSAPYGPAYPPVPSWLPPIIDVAVGVLFVPPRLQPSHCYGYGLDKGNQSNQLTNMWVPHDPSRGGTGVVDITPYLMFLIG